MEQNVGGARGRRAADRVVDRVPAERRQHLFGAEVLAEILARRRAEQIERVGDRRPVASRAGREPGEPGEVARPSRGRIGRSGVDQRRDQLGEAGQLGLEAGQGAGVCDREALELLLGGRDVVVERERRSVRVEVERRPRRVDGDPALDQPQVAPHRLAQHAEHVGPGGGAEARCELLRHAAAADDLAALEDHGPQPRLGEVVGGDEAVVAAADDRDVAGRGRRAHDSSCLIFANL